MRCRGYMPLCYTSWGLPTHYSGSPFYKILLLFLHTEIMSYTFLSCIFASLLGTSGVEISAGLHWYLKHYCAAHVSWDKTGGAQLSSVPRPGSLPRLPSGGILIQRPVGWSYYQNAVTSSCKLVFTLCTVLTLYPAILPNSYGGYACLLKNVLFSHCYVLSNIFRFYLKIFRSGIVLHFHLPNWCPGFNCLLPMFVFEWDISWLYLFVLYCPVWLLGCLRCRSFVLLNFIPC